MVGHRNKPAIIIAILGLATVSRAADNETTTFLLGEVSPQPRIASENLTRSSSAALAAPGATISSVAVDTTRGMQRSTLGTEPVRHSFGRGLPVPHYHLPDSRWGPFFEEGQEPYNITARVGSTVRLDCRIGLLQDKTVTWLHHKEDSIHLLTVGRSAYSSDERITLSFRYPNNFRLEIVYVTRRDEGLYECQVATHPPKVKRLFLKVTAPELTIVDESGREVTERYYKAGSALELTCIATQVGGAGENRPITWRQGDRTLTMGISSNNSNISTGTDMVVSTLTVAPLQKRHSGNYTCAVGTLAFATVAVHVLNGRGNSAVRDRESNQR
ncbi:uncharacterized protein LOC116165782 [Photinus pyralis]|uniref:uncharacterized protein LOC116165782 n=1 Tax=Photinus pyralis TaxID=7054 RepID=UPI00126713CB|nr:uncharacterized protein LOC116165782 [Photinus pyralis]